MNSGIDDKFDITPDDKHHGCKTKAEENQLLAAVMDSQLANQDDAWYRQERCTVSQNAGAYRQHPASNTTEAGPGDRTDDQDQRQKLERTSRGEKTPQTQKPSQL
jgi:hypothetical protein